MLELFGFYAVKSINCIHTICEKLFPGEVSDVYRADVPRTA